MAIKLQLLDGFEKSGLSQAKFCELHGIKCTKTLRMWKASRNELEKLDKAGKDLFRRDRDDPLARIKQGIMDFYEANLNQKAGLRLPFTNSLMVAKALELKASLLKHHHEKPFLSEKEFVEISSFQCCKSFCTYLAGRFGWKSIRFHGSAGDVDVDVAAAEMKVLQEKVAKYDLENVYNMDETGLFYKLLPRHGYVHQSECRSMFSNNERERQSNTCYMHQCEWKRQISHHDDRTSSEPEMF